MNISIAKQEDRKCPFLFNSKNSPFNEITKKDQDALPVIKSLQTLLQYLIDNISNKVEDSLTHNVNVLQDSFIELLYEKLEGIDTQHKITLCLDPLQSLVLAHEHPQKEKIIKIIKENNELSYIFSQIYIHASALRSIRRLKYIASTGSVEEVAPNYYINLKGEMNHFYFY